MGVAIFVFVLVVAGIKLAIAIRNPERMADMYSSQCSYHFRKHTE